MHNPGDTPTSELARFLPQIRRNSHDPDWLDDHADDLYGLISEHNRPQFVHEAATALTLIARHFLYTPQRQRWEKLLDRQVLLLLNIGDEESIRRVRHEIGYYDMAGNRADAAKLSFERSLERTTDDNDRVEAYINIVRAASLQPYTPNHSSYAAMLHFAAGTTNPYTRGLVYEAAAQYRIRQEESVQAAGFAQTAYAIWHSYYQRDIAKYGETTRDVHRHMGICLMLMTMCARVAQQTALMEHYLMDAIEHFKTQPDKHHYWTAFYELGVLQQARKNHAAAVESFETVIAYAADVKMGAYVALAMYCRGVSLTHLAQYGRAEIMLAGALERWQTAKDTANIANAEHATGFMYLKQDNKDAATTWLYRAMRTAERVETEPLRSNLIGRIEDDIKKL
ncbi:MAG: tetratricopeptide repeat protein [Chloroflexota bacterium]